MLYRQQFQIQTDIHELYFLHFQICCVQYRVVLVDHEYHALTSSIMRWPSIMRWHGVSCADTEYHALTPSIMRWHRVSCVDEGKLWNSTDGFLKFHMCEMMGSVYLRISNVRRPHPFICGCLDSCHVSPLPTKCHLRRLQPAIGKHQLMIFVAKQKFINKIKLSILSLTVCNNKI